MQPLTGFRDFLPASCAERNYIFANWREVAGRYGFVDFDGPVLEELDLYKKKSGDEIVRQLYEFVDKGERAVALRPEMTPTLARIVAAEHRQFRWPLMSCASLVLPRRILLCASATGSFGRNYSSSRKCRLIGGKKCCKRSINRSASRAKKPRNDSGN